MCTGERGEEHGVDLVLPRLRGAVIALKVRYVRQRDVPVSPAVMSPAALCALYNIISVQY